MEEQDKAETLREIMARLDAIIEEGAPAYDRMAENILRREAGLEDAR